MKYTITKLSTAKVCPYTSVGKAAVQRHFLKNHVAHDGKSPKLLSEKSREVPSESLAVKGKVKKEDDVATHDDDTSESDANTIAANTKEVDEPKLKRPKTEKESEKMSYKCEKCDHTSSRKTSLAQHVKRVHEEDCENFEGSDNDGQVYRGDIEEHERALLARFSSGKTKDVWEHGKIDYLGVKNAAKSDSKAEEKLYEHEKLDNASSRRTSFVKHIKRSRGVCEKFKEESESVGQVSRAEMKERERAPLAQFNEWPTSKVAKNCAIQISLDSLGLLRGIAQSQAPKCL